MLDPSQYEFWQKQPVTAVITCTDAPGKSDGGNCACSPNIVESGTQRYWSSGIPNSDQKIGPDIMSYSRVISNNSAL